MFKYHKIHENGTRKAEVLNSLIINTTAKANDKQTIVCFGRSIYYMRMILASSSI